MELLDAPYLKFLYPFVGESLMKLRSDAPWMSAREYGQSLREFTQNLLVKDIPTAPAFQREVMDIFGSRTFTPRGLI